MNNTNNINSVLEAVGELDNTVLENAFKPKRKKPVALIVIAAAAAVSLLVGFTYAINIKHSMVLNGEPLFEYNIKVHDEVTIPPYEEIEAMGETYLVEWVEDHGYIYYTEARPSAVLEKYALTPLINNNFSDDINSDNYPELLWDDTYLTYVYVPLDDINSKGVTVSFLLFRYYLIDKQSGLPVYFTMMCHIEEPKIPINHSHKAEDGNYELIGLNNGETAYVEQQFYEGLDELNSHADFIYDGIIYSASAHTDLNGMKQILSNLGITAE